MSNVASITAVTAASRSGSLDIIVPAATPVSAPTPASPPAAVQATANAQQNSTVPDNTATTSPNGSTSSSASASVNPRLPLGLLLAVPPPASDNSAASSDYVAMQDALRANNLSAAQQAYQRLQGDLDMDPAAVSATKTSEAGVATAHPTTSGTAATNSNSNTTSQDGALNAVA